ncbi:MAG: hypothetical protein J5748_07045 [Bacteroidales bacterium]|nr:hypothetical protein [Bacteroidales bacterium]
MKKILYFAAMFAAVMVSFNACNKDNKGGDDDPEEEEFVSLIKVDGEFADWAALPAANVAVAQNQNADKNALRVLKAYADAVYLNIYFEFDGDQIVDRGWPAVHVYLNSDGNTATGGYGDEFADACVDCMMETAIFSSGEWNDWNPSFWHWWGEANGTGWEWTAPGADTSSANLWGAELGEGSGIAHGMGSGNAYEIQIIREMLPNTPFADTFGVGIDIQQNWSSVAWLPNAASTDDNPTGLAPMLNVTIVK